MVFYKKKMKRDADNLEMKKMECAKNKACFKIDKERQGVFMQKRWLMIALMATFITGCGCGPKSKNTPAAPNNDSQQTSAVEPASNTGTVKPTQAKEAIEVDLTTEGWQLKTINAGELGLSDRPNITQSFGGYNPSTEWLVYALWFVEENDAISAFDNYVPDEGTVENQDGKNYKQSLVTLDNGEGLWLFRQVGQCVFGLWAPYGTDTASMETVFDSFQEGTASSVVY